MNKMFVRLYMFSKSKKGLQLAGSFFKQKADAEHRKAKKKKNSFLLKNPMNYIKHS